MNLFLIEACCFSKNSSSSPPEAVSSGPMLRDPFSPFLVPERIGLLVCALSLAGRLRVHTFGVFQWLELGNDAGLL